ncbi:helix-turn-helix domain-containing protein [Streptomyces sp. NPDC090445]|uniref:helix-turn-helix domain-containing protein n=1 Tax=Streptomyces sp. NPDC090445 TaxID=3365963 RepID=UPI003817E30E
MAQLAGVSVDHYVRLERGRTSNASASVLVAVTRALRLDPAEPAHLFDLADSKPRYGRRRPTSPQRVRAGLLRVLDACRPPAGSDPKAKCGRSRGGIGSDRAGGRHKVRRVLRVRRHRRGPRYAASQRTQRPAPCPTGHPSGCGHLGQRAPSTSR